jgi:dTDP-4-amino-4,6-dideoxygalactose transaminase
MVKTKSIYPSWPSFSKLEIDKVKKILVSGKVNYWTGNYCIEFEKKFSKFFGNKYSISLSSGSVALELALKSLHLKKNDEVLVTPRSYIASASSVILQDLKPIFIDIDLNSQNILLESLKKKITKKTKAIILVHLAGFPCEMDEIKNICKLNNIKIIEDCSQAHGAKYKSKYVGSFGDIAIWSFCNDKIMSTCGEGAIASTNNYTYYSRMWALKDCGKNVLKFKSKYISSEFRWVHDSIGSNYRMTELQAAVGMIQLKKLNLWVKKRNLFCNKIKAVLEKFSFIRVQKVPPYILHSYYRFYFFLDINKTGLIKKRSKIINALKKNDIQCNVGSCPEIYLEKAFKKFRPKKRLKNAKKLSISSIALIINHQFTNQQQKNYLKSLNLTLKKFN